jgi:ectoine hydroxylase-related dioxygenase (phytanoyl-CoA dioxygenase family)
MTTIVLPRPTGNVEQVESDLTEFGYGILSGHLSPALTAEVRGILGAEIAKEEAAGAVREAYTDRDAKNRRLLTVVDRHPRFQELLEDPTLLRLVAHLLGPSYLDEHYLLHSYSANVTRPGSAAMGIHADIDYLRPAAPYRTFPAFAQVIWFLDDFDEEVGATRVVPRSHLYPEGPVKDGSVTYESVPAEGPGGSLLVFDGRLFHGTGANVSPDRERAGLIAGYIQPCLRPLAHYPSLLDPRAMAGASEFVRQLLGYGTVNVGFDQPWRHVRADVAELAVGGRRTLEDTRRQARPETRD